jgi:hypothetical protein
LDHGRCKLRGMLFDVLPVQSQSTRPNSLSLSLIFFSLSSRLSSFYILLSLVWNLGTWVGGWWGFQVWVSWKRGWGLKSAEKNWWVGGWGVVLLSQMWGAFLQQLYPATPGFAWPGWSSCTHLRALQKNRRGDPVWTPVWQKQEP